MASLEAILERAQSLTDNEHYEEAYKVLTAAYNEGKENPEFMEKIALAASTLDKKDEAVQYWEELINIAPNSMVAYTELQDAYCDTNRYKYYLTRARVKILNSQVAQAIPDYKKAIENTHDEKERADANLLMAKAYEFLGKTMNAIDEYYKVAPILNTIEIYIKIADLYVSEKDKLSAISVLESALEHFKDQNNDTVKELLSRLYLEVGNTEKAEQYAISDLLKIKIKLSENKNDEAYELLQKVPDKHNAEYHKLAAEYYFNKKDWDNCINAINDFAKFEPNHPLVYQMRSLVCEGQGNVHDAHANRAKMYNAKGQKDIALHEYMQAHHADKNNIQTIEEIINLCEECGEKHTAGEFYEKLLKLSPKNERALIKSGDFYYDLGEYQVAASYYERAAEVSHVSEVFLKAGKCFEKMRKEKTARYYYEKYLAKAPMSASAETELIKAKLNKLSNEEVAEDEGFLEKILGFFSKK